MRTACIGLFFHKDNEEDLKKLIMVSVESARITHHNAVGYLGGFCSAYFTALAIRNVDPKLWLIKLMECWD